MSKLQDGGCALEDTQWADRRALRHHHITTRERNLAIASTMSRLISSFTYELGGLDCDLANLLRREATRVEAQ